MFSQDTIERMFPKLDFSNDNMWVCLYSMLIFCPYSRCVCATSPPKWTFQTCTGAKLGYQPRSRSESIPSPLALVSTRGRLFRWPCSSLTSASSFGLSLPLPLSLSFLLGNIFLAAHIRTGITLKEDDLKKKKEASQLKSCQDQTVRECGDENRTSLLSCCRCRARRRREKKKGRENHRYILC